MSACGTTGRNLWADSRGGLLVLGWGWGGGGLWKLEWEEEESEVLFQDTTSGLKHGLRAPSGGAATKIC